MTDLKQYQLYRGDGSTIGDRGVSWDAPAGGPLTDDPAGYLADRGLRDAVNVALTLGQPLLVTGEPGTGKTQLAASIAHELELPPPLVFNTKTTSTARDLFYRYDALRHFHDAQFGKEQRAIEGYIEFECLGLAILLAMPAATVDAHLPGALRGTGPHRSVVLVDEIDKAPRDLPNDVLNEIERMEFAVRETGQTFAAGPDFKPVVVLTSNSEKTLPDAFLRRCVFYHIAFPDTGRLAQIVERRLRFESAFTPSKVEHAIRHFERLRELGMRKRPATAELLAWLRVLERLDIDVEHLKPGEAEAVAFSYSVLAKSREDLALLQRQARA